MAGVQDRALPFIKWAGGKGQLLDQYEAFFPNTPGGDYYEPFAGSGAVFFHLRGKRLFDHYALSDANPELVNCYLVVRDQLDNLIDCLREHEAQHGHDHYYTVRNMDRSPDWEYAAAVDRAARLIYLNKTCYNGLWRVNSRGYFNVPMGRYKKPDILSVGRLCAASAALHNVEISTRSFEDVLDRARPGDFVYFDPPYVPLSDTSNFTSYSMASFDGDDQRRLAQIFAALDQKGCRVMLSNSDMPFVRDLYRGFRVETVNASRRINSKVGKRGLVGEVVVLNYG